MQHKILIVDDEPVIREVLEFNLKSEGFDVAGAESAEEAMAKMDAGYSLILLDVMMGGMSGYKFAETLRNQHNQTPIIFLTAKDTENDMLTGFSVGGDDYISKPFSIKEVIARIKAVLKRRKAIESDRFIFKDLTVDFNLKIITLCNEKVALTKTEFKILAFLIRHRDKVIPRHEFIDEIWKDYPYITERTVDVHITRLRKKLGDYARLISHTSGFGYRFNL
ncbi:MAG: response regulator transcription factor [Tannerella sp.]|jgi:DNA-binding response OmpR family regulator|nr:response regulator transcription factor [Tannerella sp.]MDR1221505.1 response regulator transcription factor [Tannerella sp.]